LKKEQIEEIVENAKKFEAEDEKLRKQIQAKNDLENFVYQVRNTLDDTKYKNLLKEEDKKKNDNYC
jgi:molecular chaperone DnaK (HSP70)